MNEQATILLNISSSFSGINAGKGGFSAPHFYFQRSLYAALTRSFYKQEGIEILGRQLAIIARHAHLARQIAIVEQVSQLMLYLPLSDEQKAIAQYYQAICIKRRGNIPGARNLLQLSLEKVPSRDQARILLSLGATYFDNNEIVSSLPYYIEAARAAGNSDPTTRLEALREIAIIRSIQGDHYRAITELDALLPSYRTIVKYHPTLYYEFLNSYAVELGEVGRIAEAQNVCAVTLASPFAAAYPEFAQTRAELDAKRTAATPSVIVVPAAASEIISSTQAEVEAVPEPARARSITSLDLRRSFLPSRELPTVCAGTIPSLVIAHPVLSRLADSILPRGPPTVS
jgi:tetratricopeptide (TPR) repeat protein